MQRRPRVRLCQQPRLYFVLSRLLTSFFGIQNEADATYALQDIIDQCVFLPDGEGGNTNPTADGFNYGIQFVSPCLL